LLQLLSKGTCGELRKDTWYRDQLGVPGDRIDISQPSLFSVSLLRVEAGLPLKTIVEMYGQMSEFLLSIVYLLRIMYLQAVKNS
jgi:hypothetical protein